MSAVDASHERTFTIDPDIRRAETPPGRLYTSEALYQAQLERLYRSSWQFVPQPPPLETHAVAPFTLLPGSLDEPLLWTRQGPETLHCLSNVCTHRAHLVAERSCSAKTLRCRYHGRRFELDGRFASMPEFEQAEGFPRPEDDLARARFHRLGPLGFVSLGPDAPAFEEWFAPVLERLAFLPWDTLRYDPDTAQDYDVAAHWALYCENFLEGFHIPFVHEALNQTLDYGNYRTLTFHGVSLQIGVAAAGQAAFDLPAEHPDAGESVGGYYFFLAPNLMLNFYPWGLSLNLVEPCGVERTRVRFLPFVWNESLRDRGAGSGLHQVEMEDEEVVENCQRGLRSRLYRRGRYSPSREVAVHHFHRWLCERLFDGEQAE